MKFQEAFQFASKRRPVIFPNMGFQQQLSEFEKLLHLKKSYTAPQRVNMQLNKTIKNQERLLKGFTKSFLGSPDSRKPVTFSPNQTMYFGDPDPRSEERYDRVNFLDRTDAFGGEDKLGRLAEINKSQLHQALREVNNFARTDAGFNRQMFQKGKVNNNK